MSDDLSDLRHVDGVWWYDAPRPQPEHWCWAQTSGWIGLNQVERCACGASRWNRSGWRDQNSRHDGGFEPVAAQQAREAGMGDDGSVDALFRRWAIEDAQRDRRQHVRQAAARPAPSWVPFLSRWPRTRR